MQKKGYILRQIVYNFFIMKTQQKATTISVNGYIVKIERIESAFRHTGCYFLGKGNITPYKNTLTNVSFYDATRYKTKASALAGFVNYCDGFCGKNETCKIISLSPKTKAEKADLQKVKSRSGCIRKINDENERKALSAIARKNALNAPRKKLTYAEELAAKENIQQYRHFTDSCAKNPYLGKRED